MTVEDADNKVLELRIAPFGCQLTGLKNSIRAVTPGSMYTTTGTPAEINNDIANMLVRAYQANAQVALELVYDTTKIRKYLIINTDTDTDTTSSPITADGAEVDNAVLSE